MESSKSEYVHPADRMFAEQAAKSERNDMARQVAQQLQPPVPVTTPPTTGTPYASVADQQFYERQHRVAKDT